MLPLPALRSQPPRAIATRRSTIPNPYTSHRRNPNTNRTIRLHRIDSRFCFRSSNRDPNNTSPDEGLSGGLFDLRKWEVPWDWKVTLYVMMPYLLSILFTGAIKSSALGGQHPLFDNELSQYLVDDEMAVRFFVDNLLKGVVKLTILYVLISPYQPLPRDILSIRWSQPLNLRDGYIVWATSGLVVASSLVFLLSPLTGSLGSSTNEEVDSLVRIQSLIGSSGISSVCLIGTLGVVAPICEEIIYRGFFLTSLTKWLPLHLSIIVSSAVFTLAHQSPGKSPEIFVFGLVLGLVYSQTRNLLCPLLMHVWWNVGVLTLTFLQS